MDPIIAFLKAQFLANPARYIAYVSVAAITGAVKLSEALGSPMSADSNTALAVGTIATFIVTELVRRFVYSPTAVAAIVNTPPVGAGPIAAAEAAGVDVEPVEPAVGNEKVQ
jgi:hypothetical protein